MIWEEKPPLNSFRRGGTRSLSEGGDDWVGDDLKASEKVRQKGFLGHATAVVLLDEANILGAGFECLLRHDANWQGCGGNDLPSMHQDLV